MALCWGRHFKSCCSSTIFSRRASQSVSLHQKLGISGTPLPHQVTVQEHCRTGGHELTSRLSTGSMFYTQERKAYKEITSEQDNYPGRPEKAQLKRVSQVLAEDLPSLFSKTLNYTIYHPNIVLENNIRGTRTIGLMNFVLELLVIKLIAHCKFTNVILNLLKITEHIEDGTVRVRWRAEGVSFFSYLSNSFKGMRNVPRTSWYDGFSTYYVYSDGLVHKLTVDKMMPDSEEKVSSSLKSQLATKVAFAIGISFKDLSVPPVCSQEMQQQANFFKPKSPLHVNRTFTQKLL